MRIVEIEKNVVEVESDALIYSTNTRLALTGGVGAALVKAFGPGIQFALTNESTGSGMELAQIGEVLSAKTRNMPWKLVLHTVCSDGSYVVDPNTVKAVLGKSLLICERHGGIKTISVSELGTGYGTITRGQFRDILNIAVENFQAKNIETIQICSIKGDRH